MKSKMSEIPTEQLLIEHYLFDLDQPVEKTAEILDIDKNTVRQVLQENSKFYSAIRKNHQ